MFALSQVHTSRLSTRTEQVKPAPYVKPIQAKKNYPNGYIDVKPVAMKRIEMLHPRKWCCSVDIQRLGCVAVNFGRASYMSSPKEPRIPTPSGRGVVNIAYTPPWLLNN